MNVLLYGSETIIWRENERSNIRAVQTNNLGSLLSIRRMERVPNACIRKLCGVEKRVDEGIYESVPHRFGQKEW